MYVYKDISKMVCYSGSIRSIFSRERLDGFIGLLMVPPPYIQLHSALEIQNSVEITINSKDK